jgi:hypothetical protein
MSTNSNSPIEILRSKLSEARTQIQESGGTRQPSWLVIGLLTVLFWPLGLWLGYRRYTQDKTMPPQVGTALKYAGAVMTAFSGLLALTAMFDPSAGPPVAVPMLGAVGVFGLLWRVGAKLESRLRAMRAYVDLIVNRRQRSLDAIASSVRGGDIELVMQEIQGLIDNGLLNGFRMDHASRTLVETLAPVAGGESPDASFTCVGCGATNSFRQRSGTVACEYCGLHRGAA